MEIINQFGALLGIAALVVIGFVYLWSVGKRTRADVIRQDNADLRASNGELRSDRDTLEATVKEQRESIQHLRDIATQTPAVTKLIEMNNEQSKQQNQQHLQVVNELSKLTSQIGNLAKEFGQIAKAINASYNKGGGPK